MSNILVLKIIDQQRNVAPAHIDFGEDLTKIVYPHVNHIIILNECIMMRAEASMHFYSLGLSFLSNLDKIHVYANF